MVDQFMLPLILFIGVFVQPAFQKHSVINKNQYGVILDVGSSSTKVRIYRWFNEEANPTDVPEIHLAHNKRIKVSLEDLAHDEEGLERELMMAIDIAVEYINNTETMVDFTQISMYVMSTAGTRTLTGYDARHFVKNIRKILSNSSINPFYFKASNIQILSGEEEGVYSWLSTNYLLGFFNFTGPPVSPVGILEMGGGSTQISFIPHDPLYDGEFHLYVAKRRYDLYVHSYLNFGQNYMKHRVNNWLLHHHKNKPHISDPCRLVDDNIKVKRHNKTMILHGSGNITQCQHIIQSFIKKAEGDECSPKPCAIGHVYQPHVSNITFYAFGAFKYAPSSLNALDESKTLNITRLQEATELQCAKNISEISEKDKRYASEYCLMGVYLSLLLTKAYGFNETTSKIIVSDRIHGMKTDWTLGVMLHEILQKQAMTTSKPVVELHCPNLGKSVHSSASTNAKLSWLNISPIMILVSVNMWLLGIPGVSRGCRLVSST
ncbi:hypothetical protein SNE40_009054 [Patella caerulea]|uniref:Apyrase n=1 Tax=Patella caerulea TaxID=87958 RepID=A0AAN8Q2J5_PATCE